MAARVFAAVARAAVNTSRVNAMHGAQKATVTMHATLFVSIQTSSMADAMEEFALAVVAKVT